MIYVYTTVAGDTWDQIALKVYGDEFMLDHLLTERLNYPLLDYEVFPAGVNVYVPEIDISEFAQEEDLPDWRKD